MKVVILLVGGLAVISAAPLDEDQKAVQDQDLDLPVFDDIQDAAGNSLDSYDRRLYQKVSYFIFFLVLIRLTAIYPQKEVESHLITEF